MKDTQNKIEPIKEKLDDKINKVGTSVASGTTTPAAAGSAGPQVAEAAAI